MPGRLPRLTTRQVLRVLARDGWVVLRQTGGHIVLTRVDGTGRVIVPSHPGDVDAGTLRGILRQAGIDDARFHELRSG